MRKKDIILHLKKKGYILKNKYICFDSFRLFAIDEVLFEKKDIDNVLIFKSDDKIFEYWIDQDLFIAPWQTNWFQLKDSFLFKLKKDLLIKLTSDAVKKAGNIKKLCEYLNMSCPSFYNLVNKKGVEMISVKKLRRLLSYLDIKYDNINKKIEYTKKGHKISIKFPNFPINLNNANGAFLLGCLTSDGCIYLDKKARDTIRTKYSTGENESIHEFVKAINKIYGKTHIQKEDIRNCQILRVGSSIIGGSLLKVGAIKGQKAKVNGGVPWLIKYGSLDLKRNYLKAAFNDEAPIYIGKKAYDSYIVLSRYKHLKDLTKNQKEIIKKLEKNMTYRKFPTGHINRSIPIKRALKIDSRLNNILKHSIPQLLIDESLILNEFGIESRIWKRSLNLTSNGNYSVCCDMFVNKNNSMIKFYKEIGFYLKKKKEKLINTIKVLSDKNGIKDL